MASSSGTSSMIIESSEEDLQLQLLMEQRKKKRKQSNRESARRSRMRKQKHVDDLIAQVEHLKKENSIIITKVNITTQHFLKVEAQNCILRAQKSELTQSLQSLNDIIYLINSTTGVYQLSSDQENNNNYDNYNYNYNNNNFMNPMHMAYVNQPIVAAADMFQW